MPSVGKSVWKVSKTGTRITAGDQLASLLYRGDLRGNPRKTRLVTRKFFHQKSFKFSKVQNKANRACFRKFDNSLSIFQGLKNICVFIKIISKTLALFEKFLPINISNSLILNSEILYAWKSFRLTRRQEGKFR